jgi:hypothetical protein
VDLGEVLPLRRGQRGVDQRQPVGLLVGQVPVQLGRQLVDDVAEPLVAVVRVGRKALLAGFDRAVRAIPASLDLSAP